MKKNIILVISASCIHLILLGCSSGRAVKSESSAANVALYQESTYIVELSESGTQSVKFGPREQNQANEALQSALARRGLKATRSHANADYIVRFATYTETEHNAFAATFPHRDHHVYTHSRGINTPLGSVVTGQDTHIVERDYSITTDFGEDADRLFVIDVIDPETKELLWRGYTRRDSTRLTPKRIEEEIRRIIDELPVRQKSSTSIIKA